MVFIDDVYAGGKKTDAGGKYPLLSDAVKAGLFHPRCKDSSSMYLEGISTPPDREVLPKKAQEDLTEIERAEQKAAYGKRMEKMNKRLSKYALDPDNKKMYRGRAEQWAEYTEKWQSYHEKQLEKAEKDGIINNKTLPINLQLFAHSSDYFPTVLLSKKEYAHVMSELETNISFEQRTKKVFKKAIGDYYYTVENNGSGNYRIIGKVHIE